jgi:5-methylcytosine-specific restriction endonuclease McrA
MSHIPTSLRNALYAEKPEARCAYCQSPERLLGIPLEADHIIPESAGGETSLKNLCLCCRSCNGYKGTKINAIDSQTGRRISLFHPRRQKWSTHFAWSQEGTQFVGITPTGRATVEALRIIP